MLLVINLLFVGFALALVATNKPCPSTPTDPFFFVCITNEQVAGGVMAVLVAIDLILVPIWALTGRRGRPAPTDVASGRGDVALETEVVERSTDRCPHCGIVMGDSLETCWNCGRASVHMDAEPGGG